MARLRAGGFARAAAELRTASLRRCLGAANNTISEPIWPKGIAANPILLFRQVVGSAPRLSGHVFIAPPPSMDRREPGRWANRQERGACLPVGGQRGRVAAVDPADLSGQVLSSLSLGECPRRPGRWTGGPRLAATSLKTAAAQSCPRARAGGTTLAPPSPKGERGCPTAPLSFWGL